MLNFGFGLATHITCSEKSHVVKCQHPCFRFFFTWCFSDRRIDLLTQRYLILGSIGRISDTGIGIGTTLINSIMQGPGISLNCPHRNLTTATEVELGPRSDRGSDVAMWALTLLVFLLVLWFQLNYTGHVNCFSLKVESGWLRASYVWVPDNGFTDTMPISIFGECRSENRFYQQINNEDKFTIYWNIVPVLVEILNQCGNYLNKILLFVCLLNLFISSSLSSSALLQHITAMVECGVSAVVTLLVTEPIGLLSIRSCRVQMLSDWYTMLYNPSPDYVTTMHCTQEAVYPLWVI